MVEAIVEVRNVKKTYRLGETTVTALNGVSLALASGEFSALVGASGSGKSTLLNLVGCIDDPDEGAVLLAGQDVGKLDDDAKSKLRNKKIGFIFQSFNLVPVLSVFENVELPLLIHAHVNAAERKDKVLRALADVGISEYVSHAPDKLSGGQRQRVAIARALVTEPALVLADEPTANLDSVTTHRIVDLMLELNQKRGVTFFFSTHDEKLMSRVGRIIHIQDGLIVP
ncbi:MAG: ABC transporter ATP-binding protein [Deltaproteobacteria bacterium]|nr:ABC transporter ATP-binding protein [Deltaproteobacteria bacterium]